MKVINIPEAFDFDFLSNPTEGWLDIDKTPPPLNEVVALIMSNPAYNSALMCFEGKRITDKHVELSSGSVFPIKSFLGKGNLFTHWQKISEE